MHLHDKILLESPAREDVGTVVSPDVWIAGSIKDMGYSEQA